MDMLNQIEIRGIVGNYSRETIQDKTLHRFSVVTSYATKDREGNAVVEMQWFQIGAWDGKKISIPENTNKGFHAHVKGRLRLRKFINSKGEPDTIAEIIPSEVEITDPANKA